MAGSANVLTDDSLLSRIDQKLNSFGQFLALISGLAVFSLMILAVLSVGGRNFFDHPLPGYIDWIEQAMPLIAFMGVSYTQRNGGHIRMDMLVGRLSGRTLYFVELITTLAILFLMVLIVWGSWAHFERSFDFGSPLWSRDSSMDISLPLWPAKLLAPIAFSVLCLQLLVQIWGYIAALISGTDQPIAVPLIEDVAAQAAHEAEHVTGHDS
ncbi:TRAP transporter small permease subunit [Terasakiella pusilla]|uniref:TRAP transporter small permease subunit n=1 Tax=Terasakiella pusilla TaxID=64973 RepID=UPI00048B7678|nr:TRAP transporter small permease [Terasakiella pusilla]